MSRVRLCPQCQRPLPRDAPEGLCPRCSLEGALAAAPAVDTGKVAGSPSQSQTPVGQKDKGLTLPRRFGDYELLQEIARGGMGRVFKARQISLNRIVALKVMLGGPFNHPLFVECFHLEARAAARLQHPNIVAIHEVGECDGQLFFTMDFVDGPNLAQLAGHKPLAPAHAARYLQALAGAVQYAHEHGTVHRDLKPSNVLVDARDQPRITDFGLAKSLHEDSELTVSGQVLGTPGFLAPEQAGVGAGEVGPAVDVYALGAVLYYLLTGRPPFTGETLETVLQQVTTQEPVPVRLLSPAVPRDLQTICLKCLEKSPASRYASARELAEDLTRFLAGEPIHARPVAAWGRAWRWCRRKPLVAGLAAALGWALVLGTGGIVWQWQRAERHARVADAATQQAQADLWKSLLTQAQANRWSGLLGRKAAGLEVVARAARLRPSVEVRSEAIAHLALLDFQEAGGERTLADEVSIAFAPDLEQYALADGQRRVGVYRTADHQKLFEWQGAKGSSLVSYSPDGRRLCAGINEALTVLDAGTGRVLFEVARVVFTLFSPDSQVLAIVHEDGQVRFYDGTRGEAVLRALQPRGRPRRLAFHPDGRFLVVATDKGVELWDWRQAKWLESPPGSADVTAVACHEHFLAWGTGLGEIQILDLRHRQTRRLQAHKDLVSRLGFDPRGEVLVSTSYDTVCRFWDPHTGQAIVQTLRGTAYDFSPDGSRLAYTRQFGLGLWLRHAPTGFRVLHCDEPGDRRTWVFVERVDFSPDGRLLAAAKPGGVCVLDVRTGERLLDSARLPGKVAFFEATGRSLILVTSEQVQRYPLARSSDSSSPRLQLGAPTSVSLPARAAVVSAALSPDRRWLVITLDDEAVRFDLVRLEAPPARYRPLALPKHPAASADGRWVATGTFHGEGTRVWDARSGRGLGLLHRGNTGTAFSPDGAWLVSADLRECRLYEVANWTLRHTLPLASASDLPGVVAFAPDGRLLALARDRYTLDLLHIPSATVLATLHSPNPQTILDLAFSPDGGLLAVGTGANQVQLWNLSELRDELGKLGLDW